MTELATELALTTAPPATTLAEYLAASGPAESASQTPSLIPYLGALTPQHLDAPQAETDALLSGAAIHDLGWLRRVAVRGEDRFRWLSGMVTNGVETLPERSGAYNLVLNAQGRIQGDLYVWRDGDHLELEITANQSEALLAHFDRFIIMDDVDLVPLPDQSALGLTGHNAGQILSVLGLPGLPEMLSSATGTVAGIPIRFARAYGTRVPHYVLWASSDQIPALWQALLAAGATPVGAAALETLRIMEGIPAYGIDIQSRDLPQETNPGDGPHRAISFTKGCYLGQEIVERIHSRGQVHRHLRAFEILPGESDKIPTGGTELRFKGSAPDSKPAGNLTSVAEIHLSRGLHLERACRVCALGMIRTDAGAETAHQLFTYEGGEAELRYPRKN